MSTEATTTDATATNAGQQQQTTDAPWHQSILAEDGKFTQAWQDKLPDDFAEDRQLLAQFTDLRGLTKSLKDNMAKARVNTEGFVKLPGEKASDSERAAFYKSLGVPDAPDGYGLKQPEKLPDGVAWDEAMSKKFGEVAHKIGLTPSQVKALQEFQVGYVGEQVATQRQHIAKVIEAERLEIAKRFGQDVDKNVLSAQMLAVQEGLPKEVFDPTSGDFWGVDALAFASAVASKLAKATGEDPTSGGAAMANMSVELQASELNRQAAEAYARGDVEGSRRLGMQAQELYRRAG